MSKHSIYGNGDIAEQAMGQALAQGYGYSYAGRMPHDSRYSTENPAASIRSMSNPYPLKDVSGEIVVVDLALIPPDWQVAGTGSTVYELLQINDPTQADLFRQISASQYRDNIWAAVVQNVSRPGTKGSTTVKAVVAALHSAFESLGISL